MINYSDIAQLVEQVTVNHWVAGSSPAVGAINAGVRSYWEGHPVVTRKIVGSNPTAPATLTLGPLAQPVEHQTFNLAVPSSSLGRLTINNKEKCYE